MRGFLRSCDGRLTLVTLLLAVLAAPLQPLADLGAAAPAHALACSLQAVAGDDAGAADC
jgi:hypothetical protein